MTMLPGYGMHPHMGSGYGLAAMARRTPPNPLSQLHAKAVPATAAGVMQSAQLESSQQGAPMPAGVQAGASPQVDSQAATMGPTPQPGSALRKWAKIGSMGAQSPSMGTTPRPPAVQKPQKPVAPARKLASFARGGKFDFARQQSVKAAGPLDTPTLDMALAGPDNSIPQPYPAEPPHPALGDNVQPPPMPPQGAAPPMDPTAQQPQIGEADLASTQAAGGGAPQQTSGPFLPQQMAPEGQQQPSPDSPMPGGGDMGMFDAVHTENDPDNLQAGLEAQASWKVANMTRWALGEKPPKEPRIDKHETHGHEAMELKRWTREDSGMHRDSHELYKKAWTELSPLSQGFFSRCFELGLSVPSIKSAIVKMAEIIEPRYVVQLQADLEKLAAVPESVAGPEPGFRQLYNHFSNAPGSFSNTLTRGVYGPPHTPGTPYSGVVPFGGAVSPTSMLGGIKMPGAMSRAFPRAAGWVGKTLGMGEAAEGAAPGILQGTNAATAHPQIPGPAGGPPPIRGAYPKPIGPPPPYRIPSPAGGPPPIRGAYPKPIGPPPPYHIPSPAGGPPPIRGAYPRPIGPPPPHPEIPGPAGGPPPIRGAYQNPIGPSPPSPPHPQIPGPIGGPPRSLSSQGIAVNRSLSRQPQSAQPLQKGGSLEKLAAVPPSVAGPEPGFRQLYGHFADAPGSFAHGVSNLLYGSTPHAPGTSYELGMPFGGAISPASGESMASKVPGFLSKVFPRATAFAEKLPGTLAETFPGTANALRAIRPAAATAGRAALGNMTGNYVGEQGGRAIDEFGEHSGLYNTGGWGKTLGRAVGGAVGAASAFPQLAPGLAQQELSHPRMADTTLMATPFVGPAGRLMGNAGRVVAGKPLLGENVNYNRGGAQPALAASSTGGADFGPEAAQPAPSQPTPTQPAQAPGMFSTLAKGFGNSTPAISAIRNGVESVGTVAQVGTGLAVAKANEFFHNLAAVPGSMVQKMVQQSLDDPHAVQGISQKLAPAIDQYLQSKGVDPNRVGQIFQEAQQVLHRGGEGLAQLSHFADQILGYFFQPDTVAAMHPLQKAMILVGGLSALLGFGTGHNMLGGAGAAAMIGGMEPQIAGQLRQWSHQMTPNTAQTQISPAEEAAQGAMGMMPKLGAFAKQAVGMKPSGGAGGGIGTGAASAAAAAPAIPHASPGPSAGMAAGSGLGAVAKPTPPPVSPLGTSPSLKPPVQSSMTSLSRPLAPPQSPVQPGGGMSPPPSLAGMAKPPGAAPSGSTMQPYKGVSPFTPQSVGPPAGGGYSSGLGTQPFPMPGTGTPDRTVMGRQLTGGQGGRIGSQLSPVNVPGRPAQFGGGDVNQPMGQQDLNNVLSNQANRRSMMLTGKGLHRQLTAPIAPKENVFPSMQQSLQTPEGQAAFAGRQVSKDDAGMIHFSPRAAGTPANPYSRVDLQGDNMPLINRSQMQTPAERHLHRMGYGLGGRGDQSLLNVPRAQGGFGGELPPSMGGGGMGGGYAHGRGWGHRTGGGMSRGYQRFQPSGGSPAGGGAAGGAAAGNQMPVPPPPTAQEPGMGMLGRLGGQFAGNSASTGGGLSGRASGPNTGGGIAGPSILSGAGIAGGSQLPIPGGSGRILDQLVPPGGGAGAGGLAQHTRPMGASATEAPYFSSQAQSPRPAAPRPSLMGMAKPVNRPTSGATVGVGGLPITAQ